ncbi:SSI family serine proteinase inhibitor [Streptomyces sp. NPDC015346]|uniref:SSI family serine proteinase inhibitor n=1 Tax=Streptomyces sp. NPDC015346 TaxID=3364954 RepID=UPI0036F67BB9
MLRRLVLSTLAPLAATAGAAGLGPVPPLPLLSPPDALTVTVSKSGHPNANGTYRLECGSRASGNHPAANRACERLDRLAKEGKDPFAAVDKNRYCTQQYGGPAVAHITGDWQGRPVDAHFARTDGCEIARWENLEPVLPHVHG